MTEQSLRSYQTHPEDSSFEKQKRAHVRAFLLEESSGKLSLRQELQAVIRILSHSEE